MKPIDVSITHDTLPFGLSLSKPFDKLRVNGCGVFVVIYESLNNQRFPTRHALQKAGLEELGKKWA